MSKTIVVIDAFQSLTGRLKTEWLSIHEFAVEMFQSLTGRLKTFGVVVVAP